MSTQITKANAFQSLQDFNFGDAVAEELAGLDSGFDRIKIPAGGGTVFEIPGDNPDEPEAVKEFSAVILCHHTLNSFYRTKYTGGSVPPDCCSLDGCVGSGDPGGECVDCQYNQFGSGENGGKACKQRRRIYVLREGEIFPMLLSLPTGSLKEFGRYIKRLLSKGKKSNNVVTRFSLKKASNQSGMAYSQAVFSVDRDLTPEEQSLIDALSAQVKAYSKNVGVELDEASDTKPNLDIMVDEETGEVIEPLG